MKQAGNRSTADGVPVFCAHDAIVSLAELAPNPKNPNKHPGKQLELLGKLIGAHGWRLPITVSNRSGLIVRGHGRYAAARLAGYTEAPVDYQDYADEASEYADLIADTTSSELSSFDTTLLAGLVSEIEIGGLDLELTGLESPDLGRMVAIIGGTREIIEPPTPPAPKVPRTRPGDVYQLGRHRLACLDATERESYETLLEGKRPSLLVTDPPYGVAYQDRSGGAVHGDLTQATIPVFFACVLEHLDDDARVYLFGGSDNWTMYQKLYEHHLRQTPRVCVWTKESFVLRHNGYHSQFELVYFGWKGRGGSLDHWHGDRKASDVWDVRRDRAGDRVHPTQKPVDVCAIPVRNSCPPGGDVLEPFAGSGAVLIACEQLDRTCYALELDPALCDVIVERWQQLTGEEATLVGRRA